MPNIREALEFSLSGDGEVALAIVAALQPFWMCRGMLREARQWTDRTLARAPREPTRDRVQALFSAVLIAPLHGDLSAAAARAAEARALAERTDDPIAHAGVAMAEGITALMSGDFAGAAAHLKDSLRASDDENVQVNAMLLLGWALEFAGDSTALIWQQKALDLATSRGESVYRSFALWELGISCWRHGQSDRAERLLREGLRFAQLINDQRNGAGCLEGLAWIAAQKNNPTDAVVMMGAADALARAIGSVAVPTLPRLQAFHAESESRSREALGDAEFDAARQRGGAMSFDAAAAYALREDAEPT